MREHSDVNGGESPTMASKRVPIRIVDPVEVPEPYVDPDRAAEFLHTNRLRVIRMARSGFLPAHQLGDGR